VFTVEDRARIRDQYDLSLEDIETIVALILLRGEAVVPTRRITICQDSKGNMFLDATANGRANAIVGSDEDFLSLESLLRIPIVTPAEFLAKPG